MNKFLPENWGIEYPSQLIENSNITLISQLGKDIIGKEKYTQITLVTINTKTVNNLVNQIEQYENCNIYDCRKELPRAKGGLAYSLDSLELTTSWNVLSDKSISLYYLVASDHVGQCAQSRSFWFCGTGSDAGG